MKKVLIIMATYNGEKYIEEQLDSILRQKDVQLSILVRDDGSKDRTQQILDDYKSKLKLDWYTGTHLNVAKGYFDLMKKASEYDVDYIAFSDQDDVWDEDKIFVAINSLERFPENIPNLYYSGQRLVDGDLNFIANHKLNEQRSLKTRFVLSDFAGCTGVFNKALLDNVVKYEPQYMLMHDTWILKVCLCLDGNIVVDPEVHMSYRQHGGNAVGLGRSIPAYIKQVRQYLTEYKVEEQMKELYKGYANEMCDSYLQLVNVICGYRNNFKYKRYLLDKKNIDFFSRGLNLTYNIKVLFNKL